MKNLIKALVLSQGYTITRSQPVKFDSFSMDGIFKCFDVPVPHPKLTVILIGTTDANFAGIGKASPILYFSKFGYALAKRGVSFIGYRDCSEMLRNIDRHDPKRTVFIFVYNEVFQREQMRDFALLTSLNEFTFYNSPQTGEIIGDKIATNKLLEHAGILSPARASDYALKRTFSNARFGSNAAISVLDIGQSLDPDRYNSAFINTAHAYKGKSYHVALRALTVTGTLLSAYVRLRLTEENSPSVHASNTPRDPKLIAYFHERLIDARRNELVDLCERMGSVLGAGFYSHDILPCSDDGQLYVCETGFKFDDMAFRERLWPISSDLPFLSDHFTLKIADMAAEEVVRQHL